MSCDTPVGLLAGMTEAQLRAALANAQLAYLNLATGSQGESFSYTQGDGVKAVTYTRTNMAQLQMLIRQLQQALGVTTRARRPIRLAYR
ncbi:gpW family head-tail joining protein [Phenylobacterium sp.]|uniref:gpW family head-tail joining protein n=1 Tax=Phenylobacterium sp. TaxID=1871053 RepID=UPI0035B46E8F